MFTGQFWASWGWRQKEISMRKYRNWILGLGILAAPGLAVAEPSPFGNEPSSAHRPAAGQANNQEVAENIARALRSAKLPGSNIDITVSGGVATLSGQIADGHSKAMATQLVSSVPGVMRVDNQLQVPSAAAQPQQGGVKQAGFTAPFGQTGSNIEQVQHSQPAFPAPAAPAAPGNQVMAERIGAALSSANLSGYQIKIRYAQGTATLLGSVATPQQRAMAEEVVRNVPGVSSVDNQLQAAASAANPRLQQVAYQQDPNQPMGPPPAPGPGMGYPPGPGMGYPPGVGGPAPVYNNAVPGSNPIIYNQPYMPPYAWPAQAQYPNSAAIQYPKQYAASAWPYIGPFYPYPQVPLGWRKATLEWDDGHWMLDFDSKTDRWFWFMNPKNW
jgi:osmotically-inducible protein OsmY